MARKPKYNLTLAQAERAVHWFVAIRELQDWRFTISVSADPPVWVDDEGPRLEGQAFADRNRKTMQIWVNAPGIEACGRDPLATLFHECEHAAFADAGIRGDEEDGPIHALVYQAGSLLAKAYRAGVKP